MPRVTPAAWSVLSEFPFPGNVRQLGHAIEHAMVLAAGGDIDVQHLPRDIARVEVARGAATLVPRPLGTAMKEFEREYLQRALAQADGKRTLAAEILGISRKNLWEKLRMHGMAKLRGTAATSARQEPGDAAAARPPVRRSLRSL